MIMAVVLLNGRPSVFTDTDDYFTEGRTFVVGVAEALRFKAPDPPPSGPQEIADAKQAAADLHMSHTEIGARSPFYGAFLYTTQRVATLWLTTTLQAAIGAWLMFLLWRTSLPGAALWTGFVAEAAVAFGSTLPYFTAFAMPDVFSGYAAASAILLLIFWDRLAIIERIALAVLLATAMSFHTSHLLTTVALTILGGALLYLLKAPRRRIALSVLSIVGAVLAASFANGAYKETVHIKTGDEMRRPPFLAMRMLADGPGRDYLRYACAHGENYVLCAFKDLPLTNSQDMLWSDDRKKGIFNVTTFENRLQMEKEENRFVLSAFFYKPFSQIFASLKNFGAQIIMVYLDDPLKNPHYYLTNSYWSTTNLPWLINRAADCGRDHWECGPRLSIAGSRYMHGGLAIIGVVLVIVRLAQRDLWGVIRRREFDWSDSRTRLIMLLGMLLAAVAINAFVCGALSGPFARYQARITWLITAAGALAMLSLIPAGTPLSVPAWVQRLRGHPAVQAVESRIDFSFVRFGMVGAAGFAIDAVILNLMVHVVGVNPYAGRFVSFSVAVASTWLLNRSFTFREPTEHGPVRQAIFYVAVQCAGGVANLALYSAAIRFVPGLHNALLIPLALGSAAGLCLTFAGSKYIAFRPAALANAES